MAKVTNPNNENLKQPLPSGITKQPTEEEFQLGDSEQLLLEELFKWQERSKRTNWILGKPLAI